MFNAIKFFTGFTVVSRMADAMYLGEGTYQVIFGLALVGAALWTGIDYVEQILSP